jgi:hypothetical protein
MMERFKGQSLHLLGSRKCIPLTSVVVLLVTVSRDPFSCFRRNQPFDPSITNVIKFDRQYRRPSRPTAAALSITHLYKSSVHTSKVSPRPLLIPILPVIGWIPSSPLSTSANIPLTSDSWLFLAIPASIPSRLLGLPVSLLGGFFLVILRSHIG